MVIKIPDWIEEMDSLYDEQCPFLGVISFDRNIGQVIALDDCAGQDVYFDFRGKTNFVAKSESNNPIPDVHFESISLDRYARQFKVVMEEIKHGNTYLLNLCSAAPSTDDIDLLNMFRQSKAPYRLYYKGQFIVFSPETFVTLSDDSLRTFPMKGTIDANIKNAYATLQSDEKEIAEHYTIVDLLRNDLGRVCDQVDVTRFAYLDKIKTSKGPIWQMSSEIRGMLSDGYKTSPGTMFYNLLPAGSISGAPKEKTLDIIRAVEDFDRGYYTGVMIHYDGVEFDSAVMIRFIEMDDQGTYWYKSGGGITHKSEIEKEHEELIRKIYLPIF